MQNKRNFFRVAFTGETVSIVHQNTLRSFDAVIRDLSGLGIGFIATGSDFLAKQDRLTVEFTIEGKTFQREASVVRQTEKGQMMYASETAYGCKFLNITEKEAAELASLLLRIESKRRK